MCTYCFYADWLHRYVPDVPYPINPHQPLPVQPWTPWNPWPNPTGPAPTTPPFNPAPMPSPLPPPFNPAPMPSPIGYPWTQEQLNQALEILRQIKEMEDKLGGCPCEEPQKLEFFKDIQARLDQKAEENVAGKSEGQPDIIPE